MLTAAKKEFIEFMMSADVLRFGDFTTKSGRKTPYFVNTGNYKTGLQNSRLGEFYAALVKETVGDQFDAMWKGMSNQLHRYRIVLDYIEPWLDEQDEATLKQIYADLLVLEKEGPSLGRPLVDRVKGSKLHHLKELRVTSCGGQVIRILFAFDPKRQAVLLLAGDKSRAGSSRAKWNGWYAINIPKAEQIYRRHVRRLDRDGTA